MITESIINFFTPASRPKSQIVHSLIDASNRLFKPFAPNFSGLTTTEKFGVAQKLFSKNIGKVIDPEHSPSLSVVFGRNRISSPDYMINMATNLFLDVIEEEPENYAAHFLLSICLDAQGRTSKLMEIKSILENADSGNFYVHIGLASIYDSLHRYTEARQEYLKAKEVCPHPELLDDIKGVLGKTVELVETNPDITL